MMRLSFFYMRRNNSVEFLIHSFHSFIRNADLRLIVLAGIFTLRVNVKTPRGSLTYNYIKIHINSMVNRKLPPLLEAIIMSKCHKRGQNICTHYYIISAALIPCGYFT